MSVFKRYRGKRITQSDPNWHKARWWMEFRLCGHYVLESIVGARTKAQAERTGGNPLFMINVVDYLTANEVIATRDGIWCLQVELDQIETGMPENVRQMIQKQFDRLNADRRRHSYDSRTSARADSSKTTA